MKKNIKELNPNSITAVVEPHLDSIYSASSSEAIYSQVKEILSTYNINTPASRRLLLKLQKSKDLINSQFIITNSVLAGNGLSVN